MYVILRRWLFLLLGSCGLALLIVPYRYYRSEPTERDFVELSRSSQPLVREEPPPTISAEDVRGLYWLSAILGTMDERAQYFGMIPREELRTLCESMLELPPADCSGTLLLRYEGMDLAIEPDSLLDVVRAELASQDAMTTVRHVEVVSLAELPPRIEAADLGAAPALLAFLNSYEDEPELPFNSGVPAREWRELCMVRNWTLEQDFLFGDWQYEATVDTRWVDTTIRLSGLRTVVRVVGLVTLTLAAWLGVALYQPPERSGIPIASRKTTALYDGVAMFLLMLAWGVVVDWLMVRVFDTEGLLGDRDLALLAGSAGTVGVVIVAWLTSELAEARFSVDEREIATDGLFGREAVRWEDVRSLTVEDSFVTVSRLGRLVPRRFRRNLRIDTEGAPIYVKEPPAGETRARIFSELRLMAPKRLQEDLDRIAGSW